MTREDRELFTRFEKVLDDIDKKVDVQGEAIARMDGVLTGGNGGGVCKQVSNNTEEMKGKLGKKEFYWVAGLFGGGVVLIFGLLSGGVI